MNVKASQTKYLWIYNRSIKSWLEENATEMYSTRNGRKYVIAEIFIETLKNKTYKHMASISKNVYIDKLDDLVINTCNTTVKMKSVNGKSSAYNESSKE